MRTQEIYNLLEEGNEYFVNIQGEIKRNQSDYICTIGQLGLVGGSQLTLQFLSLEVDSDSDFYIILEKYVEILHNINRGN